jgi:cytochrome c biogenesis protein CcdA
MTLTFLITLTGIAVVDSLNPSLFVTQFFLLTTHRPTGRLLAYIAGIIVVNFLGGLLILAGVSTLIGNLLTSIDARILYAGQIVIGLLLIGFGLSFRIESEQNGVKKPQSLRLWHAFVLGMVVMVNEITTALPYFVAIERIIAADLTATQSLLALTVYNMVFSLPLFAFLGLFIAYGSRFVVQIERINRFIQTWLPRVFKYGALLLGAGLVLNGALYLIASL